MGADVVVPAFRDVALTLECLESVLRHSGAALERLIVVNDASPEADLAPALAALRDRDDRVRVLTNPTNRGFIWSANLGMSAGRSDVVVLNSDTEVTAGWLEELLGALDSEPTLAALSPLSNNATMCSVPDFMGAVPVARLKNVTLDLSGLPRVTLMPTAHGFCLALRRRVLDQVGLFDLAYGRGYNEENDWCQRVRAVGFQVGRANRALVYHHGEVSFVGARVRLDVINLRRLVTRYPRYVEETRAFEASLEARIAARAVRAQLGTLRVATTLEDTAFADVAFLAPQSQPFRGPAVWFALHDGPADSQHLAAAQGVYRTNTPSDERLEAARRRLLAPRLDALRLQEQFLV